MALQATMNVLVSILACADNAESLADEVAAKLPRWVAQKAAGQNVGITN